MYKTWRTPRSHKENIPPRGTAKDIPPLKIFDNLSFIGNQSVCCYLMESEDGLILLDCMRPENAEYIEKCIVELGYDPKDLKHILITHGHGDHYGNAGYFQEKYGTKLWMGEVDEAYALDPAGNISARGPMPFQMDAHLPENGVWEHADVKIHCYLTPGHTLGCISFIFKVFDEGREHMCALWGGTGLSNIYENNIILYESCQRFALSSLNMGVTACVTNHTFMDNTEEKLTLMRRIADGVPNPFVMGYEAYHRFEKMYLDMYEDAIINHTLPGPMGKGQGNR